VEKRLQFNFDAALHNVPTETQFVKDCYGNHFSWYTAV